MKKIFYAVVGLFLLNEIAYLFTGWNEVDYLNITGLSLVAILGVVGQRMKDQNE